MSNEGNQDSSGSVEPAQGSGMKLGVLLLVGIGLAYGAMRLLPSTVEPPVNETSAPSYVLPALTVDGWLNLSDEAPPTRESLTGKVVVIDTWATWCGPCRRAMPGLAELYKKHHPEGVVFLGMTSEDETKQEAITTFADSVPGFDWPIAYGGRPVSRALGIKTIPTLTLFGTDGRSIWQGHSLEKLEAHLIAMKQ